MNWKFYILVLAIPLMAGTLGCESVALMPRPDVDRREGTPGPYDSGRYDLNRDLTREVAGTVQRVDETAREIHLQTTEGRRVILTYDARTAVSHRDRPLRVEDLRHGDLILAEVARDARGDDYAELIRMNDRPRSRDRDVRGSVSSY